MNDLSREKLIERFELLSLIGEGGMGTVYLVWDPKHEEKVALKILNESKSREQNIKERFERECLALGKLNHPNLVEIFESGSSGEKLFYTMEYLEGKSSERVIRDEGPLPAKDAITLCRDLADGLVAIHREKLLHRDIKPANVIIDKYNRAILTDFGLVKIEGMSSLTQSNVFVGTYQYAAPEVLSGLPPTPQSDIYQLGLLFYIYLSGELLPFGRNLKEIARKIMVERISPPSLKVSGITSKVDECVMKAIARDPQDRFQSAEELRDTLDEILLETMADDAPPALPALHRPRSSNRVEEEKQDPDLRLALPYLSSNAIHLILVLAASYFVFALIWVIKTPSAPMIEAKVAMSWIESDWDALSFRLRRVRDKKGLSSLIERMKQSDHLNNELNEVLPKILAVDAIPKNRCLSFALKAEHPLLLERQCKKRKIDYLSPARETLSLLLKNISAHLKRLSLRGEAMDQLARWQRQLIDDPALNSRLDRVLSAFDLPSATVSLIHLSNLLEERNRQKSEDAKSKYPFDGKDSKRKKRLESFFSSLANKDDK